MLNTAVFTLLVFINCASQISYKNHKAQVSKGIHRTWPTLHFCRFGQCLAQQHLSLQVRL